jgi:hypothetical protein
MSRALPFHLDGPIQLHDLRPLLKTKMNDGFQMTAAQAEVESPALKQPQGNAELLCWVGANERPEFIRQSALLANIWTGFGLKTSFHQAQAELHSPWRCRECSGEIRKLEQGIQYLDLDIQGDQVTAGRKNKGTNPPDTNGQASRQRED